MAVRRSKGRNDFLIEYDIWVLVTVSTALLVLSVSFIAVGALEWVTGPSVVIGLVLAPVSQTFAIHYRIISQEERKAEGTGGLRAKARLDQVYARLPGILVVAWVLAAGNGLILSSRQPICLPGGSGRLPWQEGHTCRIHRTIVAFSVIMLVTVFALFYLLETRPLSIAQSLTGLQVGSKSFVSHSATSSNAPCLPGQESQLYFIPEIRTSHAEHAQWLQRRDSLSSRKAIYPQDHRVFALQRCNQSHPSRSSPSCLTFIGGMSELCQTEKKPSYTSLAVTSLGSSNSGLSSNLGWARRTPAPGSHMDVSLLSESPEGHPAMKTVRTLQSGRRPIVTEVVPEERVPSPPPPSWCPRSLRQAPLSSDPDIQALSSGMWLERRRSVPKYEHLDGMNKRSLQTSRKLKRSRTVPNTLARFTSLSASRMPSSNQDQTGPKSSSDTASTESNYMKMDLARDISNYSCLQSSPTTPEYLSWTPSTHMSRQLGLGWNQNRNTHQRYQHRLPSQYSLMPAMTARGDVRELVPSQSQRGRAGAKGNTRVAVKPKGYTQYAMVRDPRQSIYSISSYGTRDSTIFPGIRSIVEAGKARD